MLVFIFVILSTLTPEAELLLSLPWKVEAPYTGST
jgi:hypothetical protein